MGHSLNNEDNSVCTVRNNSSCHKIDYVTQVSLNVEVVEKQL